jgi:hypothetical protein
MGATRRSWKLITGAAVGASVLTMLECTKADSTNGAHAVLQQSDCLVDAWDIRFHRY